MFCKIRDVRAKVNNAPKDYNYTKNMTEQVRKLKAKQQEEDRQILIETENRRLLERISSIIKRKKKDSSFSDTSSVISGRSGSSSVKSLNKNYRLEQTRQIN